MKMYQLCINFLSWADFHSILKEQKQKRSHWQEFVIQALMLSAHSDLFFPSTMAVTFLSFLCAEAFSHGLSAHTHSGKWSKQKRVEEELFSFLESSLSVSGHSLTGGGKALYFFVNLFIYYIRPSVLMSRPPI